MRWVNLATLVGPTAVAAVYFGLVASPRYESETQFIVRGIQSNSAAPGLESLMQAFGIARSSDDSNVVLDYLTSRDAVTALEAALPLRAMYGQKSADPLSRFPRPFFGDSFERLYWYYQDRVTALADPDTGIITVKAEAFLPEDALAIARQLLTQSEALVNAMNARMENDTVLSAEDRRRRGDQGRDGGARRGDAVPQRANGRRPVAERDRPIEHHLRICRCRSTRCWPRFRRAASCPRPVPGCTR